MVSITQTHTYSTMAVYCDHLLGRHINKFAFVRLNDTFHIFQASYFQILDQFTPEFNFPWFYCGLCLFCLGCPNSIDCFKEWMPKPISLFWCILELFTKSHTFTSFHLIHFAYKCIYIAPLTWLPCCLYLAKISCWRSGSCSHAGHPSWMALIMARLIFNANNVFKSFAPV